MLSKIESHAIFEPIGTMYPTSTYGHFLVILPTDQLLREGQELMDIMARRKKGLMGQAAAHSRANSSKNNRGAYERLEKRIDKTMSSLLTRVASSTSRFQTMSQLMEPMENDHHHLKKRQAVIFGILAAFGLSIFNTAEIAQIHSLVNKQQKEINTVIKVIQEDELIVANNTRNLKLLAENVLSLAESELEQRAYVNWQETEVQLLTLVTRYELEIERYTTVIVNLVHGKFSPELVDFSLLRNKFDEFLEIAKGKGLRTILKDFKQLFQCRITAITSGNNLAVMVHVPLVNGARLDVFKLVPIPSRMNGTLVSVLSEKDVLALNPSKTLLKELSQTELSECSLFNTEYLCPLKNVMTKDLSGCLFSLWNNNMAMVQSACDLKFEKLREVALQINSNTFHLLFPKPTSVITRCTNGTETKSVLSDSVSVTIEPGCSLITPSHFLETAPTITYKARVIPMPTALISEEDFADMIGDGDLEQVKHSLSSLRFPNVKLSMLRHTSDLRKAQKEFQEAQSFGLVGGPTTIYIALGLLVAAIMGLAIYNCVVKQYGHKYSGQRNVAKESKESEPTDVSVPTNVSNQTERDLNRTNESLKRKIAKQIC
jgi:hypothetical protein